ncbi:MAG: PQQ-binding-like beta-propeller repeat protein [Vicinamibacterales bacterium]
MNRTRRTQARALAVLAALAAALSAATMTAQRGAGTDTSASKADLRMAPAFTARQLTRPAGGDWVTVNGNLGQQRYSTLTQINTGTVARLALAWQAEYDGAVFNSIEAGGVAFGGVLYFPTATGNLVAVDATSGRTIWQWDTPQKQPTSGSNPIRGLAIGAGRVYMTTSKNVVVAVYASTGATAWQTPVGLTVRNEGAAAPVYYDGTIYQGVAGFENGRGHVDALDARTGALKWRTFVVGTAKDDPNAGGGGVWTSPSIDPSLGLLYATTGNDYVTGNDNFGPGNHEWTASIVAMDLKTGAIRWGFQGIHHDIWDYDCPRPAVFFDVEMNGTMRHGVAFECKAGYNFLLDRATGVPLLPVTEVPVPQAPGGSQPSPADVAANPNAALTQPIPAGDRTHPACVTPDMLPAKAPDGSAYTASCVYALPGAGRFVAWTPGLLGGANWQPTAVDPKLGYQFSCEMVRGFAAHKQGPFTRQIPLRPALSGWSGSVSAVDLRSDTLVWQHKWMDGRTCYSGVLATAGGIVFTNDNRSTGPSTVFAFDSKTGRELWSHTLDQPLAGPGITYQHRGKQYVAFLGGGQSAQQAGVPPAVLQRRDKVYVFALP